MLKDEEKKPERENFRLSLFTRDKKQTSDSVEVTKRNHFSEKTDKRNFGLTLKTQTNIKSFRESLASARMISSGSTTPNHSEFLFGDFSKKIILQKQNSGCLNLNTNNLTEDYNFKKFTPTLRSPAKEEEKINEEKLMEESQISLDFRNNLYETSKLEEKEVIFVPNEEKKPNESDEFIENSVKLQKENFQEESNKNEESSQENIDNAMAKSIQIRRPVKRSCTMIEIQTKFDNKLKKDINQNPLQKKPSKAKNSPIPKYMAAIDLFKRKNGFEINPINVETKKIKVTRGRKKKRIHTSPLQKFLRRSSVEVLSPLNSPDSPIKSQKILAQTKFSNSKKVFSADNSPEIIQEDLLMENFVKTKENCPTQQTINSLTTEKNKDKILNESKIIIEKLTKGENLSMTSSNDSIEEKDSFCLDEEDYLKGYHSDSVMPANHWSLFEFNKDLK